MGCQTVTQVQVDKQSILFDKGFENFELIRIENESEIFYLQDEAKQFVHQAVNVADEPTEQIKSLVYALFDRKSFNLLYDSNANTVANETFFRKEANCLSLTIMTYALAEEAGFNAQFQNVEIPEYWTRNQGFSFLNGHINLRLIPKSQDYMYATSVKGLLVDFDPLSSRKHLKKRIVNKATVIAMYYNNKGADALVDERFDEAYAYFRAALNIKDSFEPSAVNLGLLYRLKGYFIQAEASYNYALNLNPDNLTAWENLAYLYQTTDRVELANKILHDVEHKRAVNPYYHVNLGEQALESGHYEMALRHFKNALALDKRRHEVYFGLARVYFELDDLGMTQYYLERAKDVSPNPKDEKRYQAKLHFLAAL